MLDAILPDDLCLLYIFADSAFTFPLKYVLHPVLLRPLKNIL